MKKIVGRSLRILLNLVLAAALVTIIMWQLSAIKTEKIDLDLTQFSGRIISAEEIRPGTFTIKVPLSEALKFGENAILSYGREGVKIWKPDNFTSGVFLYSDLITDNMHIKAYRVSYLASEKKITLCSYMPGSGYFCFYFLLFVIGACNIAGIVSTVKGFKS